MNKCTHELKLNEEKDFVFCTKCGQRWGSSSHTLTFPPGTRGTTPVPCGPLTSPTTLPRTSSFPGEITCKQDE